MSSPAEGCVNSGSEAQSSVADGPVSVAVPSTSAAETAPVLMDVKLLATKLNQARGPILTRIRQLANPFTGDGSEDISEWLARYDGYCREENISPTNLLVYILGGNAARMYSRMMVGDVSQWDVVKGALLAEYAIPRQEAWRKFVSCRMEEGDTVGAAVYCNLTTCSNREQPLQTRYDNRPEQKFQSIRKRIRSQNFCSKRQRI